MSTADIDQHNLQPGLPHLAAKSGLLEWHRIAAERDWDSLPQLLADDVRFRNPAATDAYFGKAPMVAILRTVFAVMEDFQYRRHFGSATGYVMEFTARVGNELLIGVDIVEFNVDGKITDFMVMIRPASAVLALAEEAGRRMAAAQAPSSNR
jgi:hypothetical protein